MDDNSAHVADGALQPVDNVSVVEGVDAHAKEQLLAGQALHADREELGPAAAAGRHVVMDAVCQLQRHVVLQGCVHCVRLHLDDPRIGYDRLDHCVRADRDFVDSGFGGNGCL